ncbi:MFS transporter [Sporolactobacillus shoreicorticis]|uniref:MFS transporter n=1 Tax=Sporolactobacillus shoreicorticis TaxID=1923877 RepID=A0ABW5S3B1_9BACL|nr:MFS transporter [Sporolactobacillus shoreicorticis]MCO7125402.1 MFS transporter [Sporolactobacillus shoreicorticis]
MKTQQISVIVKNQPGILAQVSQLFSQSGLNIDAMTVGTYKEMHTSKMKILLKSESTVLERVISQLNNLADVLQVNVARPVRSRDSVSGKLSALFSKRSVAFWLVAYSLCVTLLGTNIPSPLLALYRVQWHLSPGMVTLLFAIYAVVVIPTIIISGQMSDQLGRKKLLIPGVFFIIVGSILFILSTNFTMLFISRIFQGISVGMMNGVAVAALTDLDVKQNRIKAAFVGSMAVTVGNALGPILSGVLGEYAPFPMQLAYFLHMLLAIPCFIGLFYMSEKVKHSTAIRVHRPAVPRAIIGRFYLSGMTSFIAWSIMSLMLSIIPSYTNQLVGSSNLAVAGAIVALVLSISTISQIVLKRIALQKLSIIGFIVMTAGLASLAVVLETKSLIFLFLTTVLVGFGHGPAFAGSLALTNHISPDESRGDIIASFYVLTYLGVSLPILGLGIVAHWIGLNGAILLYTLLMTLMMLVGVVFWIVDQRCEQKMEQ